MPRYLPLLQHIILLHTSNIEMSEPLMEVYSSHSGWRNSPEYLLPNHEALLRKIEPTGGYPTGGCLQYMLKNLHQIIFCFLKYSIILLVSGLFSIDAYPQTLASDNNILHSYVEEPQRIQIIHEGSLALYVRLKLIREAEISIDIESFKYAPDRSGRIISQALAQKARAGVQVRVLLDYYGTNKNTGFDESYVALLQREGIQVRYYNKASLLQPRKLLYRNHRKTIIVDGETAILGGRNQLDRFFSLDRAINRLDKEICVTGSIVSDLQYAFNYFWHSPCTHKKKSISSDRESEAKINFGIREFLEPTESDRKLLDRVEEIGTTLWKSCPTFYSSKTEYVSDLPGTRERGHVVNYMYNLLSEAKESIIIETLAFLPRKKELQTLKSILKNGITVDVITNSLYAATELIPSEIGYKKALLLVDHGLNYYAYKGDICSDKQLLDPLAQKARWSIHSKSIVIDHRHVVIGTFNFNPRSKNYDAEHGLIFYDHQGMATWMEKTIQQEKSCSAKLQNKNYFVDGTKVKFSLTYKQKVLAAIPDFLLHPFLPAF